MEADAEVFIKNIITICFVFRFFELGFCDYYYYYYYYYFSELAIITSTYTGEYKQYNIILLAATLMVRAMSESSPTSTDIVEMV